MPTRIKQFPRKLLWILRRGRFVPWVLTGIGIILSGVMWYSLNANEGSIIRQKTTGIATNIKREVENHFAAQLAALGRMAKRWEVRGGTPRPDWENDASGFIEDYSGFRAIAIIDADQVARWQVPKGKGNNAKVSEFPIGTDHKRHYQRATEKLQITVFNMSGNGNDEHFVVALIPIRRNAKSDGLIAAKIISRTLIQDAVHDAVAEDYVLEAFQGSQLVFQQNQHLLQETQWREQIYIDLPDINFRLNVTPTGRASENIRTGLPEIGLLVGIAFSGLLGYTVHIYQRAGRRRRRQAAAQRELNLALEQLQNANSAKSDFLARMSHELRTPLNAIIGFSHVIKDQHFGPVSNDRYLEYARYIFDSGTHLLDLISDVLDLSKIEAGERDIQRAPLNLADSIEESVKIFEHEAETKGINLKQETTSDLPPLNADRRALKQILSNLLSNAIKFTPKGGDVTVYANATYESIRVDVIDTGIGMSERDIQTALAPFQQVTNPLTSDDLGTGLGLPIVKSLMELHGGRLSLISNRRSGTRVTLTFPR